MPRLNLRDTENPPPEPPSGPPEEPHLHGYEDEGERKTPWIVLGAVVVLLAVVLVALNQFHVIHLWGQKSPRVVETMPEPGAGAGEGTTAQPADTSPGVGSEPTPLPTEPAARAPAPRAGRAGAAKGRAAAAERQSMAAGSPRAGAWAVQLSSWPTRGRAERLASQITEAGFNAYVAEGEVDGKTWYRVRVGNYPSSSEAKSAIEELAQKGFEGGILVK